jgi:hypothetical protein
MNDNKGKDTGPLPSLVGNCLDEMEIAMRQGRDYYSALYVSALKLGSYFLPR